MYELYGFKSDISIKSHPLDDQFRTHNLVTSELQIIERDQPEWLCSMLINRGLDFIFLKPVNS